MPQAGLAGILMEKSYQQLACRAVLTITGYTVEVSLPAGKCDSCWVLEDEALSWTRWPLLCSKHSAGAGTGCAPAGTLCKRTRAVAASSGHDAGAVERGKQAGVLVWSSLRAVPLDCGCR